MATWLRCKPSWRMCGVGGSTRCNLGDTVSGPLLPGETAQRLRQLPWLHVAGNHERQLLGLPLSQQKASDAHSSAQLFAESLPRDPSAMALLADQRDRPDWAHALLTGRMPEPKNKV